MINKKKIIKSFKNFKNQKPIDHCVIDNFFTREYSKKLENEFPSYKSDIWYVYDNPLEKKKATNNWNHFGPYTYTIFQYLNSYEFVNLLSKKLKYKLYPDNGLNGAGLHIHGQGGNLNAHLDYSLHPKLFHQRKINVIIYLNSNWKKEWGGALGFWGSKNNTEPGPLIKTIVPKFNRAIIFDNSQNSWHGLVDSVNCPKNQYRKSLAIYYLCDPPKNVSKRGKALYAPTENQKDDKKIMEIIKKRSEINTASDVYRVK